jgi:sterol 14alpha-demethylase
VRAGQGAVRGKSRSPGAESRDRQRGAAPPLVSGALPVVGHAPEFLRDQLGLLQRGYAEHGQIFRLRLGLRPAVFLAGSDLIRWAFRETDEGIEIGPALAFTRNLFGPDFYFLARREEYLRQREVMLPLFRAKMMASYLSIMERHCAALVARLGDRGTFDLPSEMNDLVLGVIMESFLGDGFSRSMPASVAVDFRDLMRGLDPVTPPWVPAPHLVRARRARDRLHGLASAAIEARGGQQADPPDFLQELVSARAADGTPAERRWVIQMALGTTFAGHDSTTGHLSWAVADLLQHPGELGKVLAEQRGYLRPGEPLDLPTIHQMTALQRALRETGRLHTVAPVMIRRAMRPLEVADVTIPAGADVFIAAALSHRCSAVFDAPASYTPDRYLTAPGLAAHLHGFGGGTHRCLGEHYAGLLAHVAVSRLLERFDLTLADTPKPVPTPAFKGIRSPCRVRYRKRLDSTTPQRA